MKGSDTVYLHMTREELDRQYDQRTLVPEMGPLLAGWRERSDAVAQRHGKPRRISYGHRAAQGIDLFEAQGARGLHVHYHGGAWKALDSSHAWFLAQPWLDAGYSFASVDFGLVPEVRLETQVKDARLALARARELASREMPLVVSGHSSGAHLAAMVALVPEDGHQAIACDSLILASGIYDLEPVRLSGRNDYLNLNRDEAAALSPEKRFSPLHSCRVTLLWSCHELEEFQRQSRAMATTLRKAGIPVARIESTVETHFDTWNLITPSLLS